MISQETVIKEAEKIGFSHVGPAAVATLRARKEVRDMCEVNSCHAYATTWSGPPACGTIEECTARMMSYDYGVLVQTTQELEDSMDYEGMMEGEEMQREHVQALRDRLLELTDDEVLPLSAGCCRLCKKCTYPESPCRFPNRAISSMEAYGLVVSDVCKANDMGYYYGKDTVTYTAVFLVKGKQ
ncbi:MAG: DUF2284 domain-containing protein [Eubacteriales bacterium]|nr:DUF2284 domain-containing protein [Eubacteriales bacterium]